MGGRGGGQHSQLCTRFLFDIFRTENQMPMPLQCLSPKKKSSPSHKGEGGKVQKDQQQDIMNEEGEQEERRKEKKNPPPRARLL